MNREELLKAKRENDAFSFSHVGDSRSPLMENSFIAGANSIATMLLKLAEALEFIAGGCLVPPDGGSPCLDDAIIAASDELAKFDKFLEEGGSDG
jgi:hypothetical protein